MLDRRARLLLAPALNLIGRRLADIGVTAGALTAAGWCAGVLCCVAVGLQHWTWALLLWLANRLLDGLDGPVARRRCTTDLGGFLDIVSDFSIYAGFVVAVAIAVPDSRVAAAALLFSYYVSGSAFLALSSLIERRGTAVDGIGDERSLRFVGGLAEGTETVVAYVLFCLFPWLAQQIAWIFTAAVLVTAIQRIVFGIRVLRDPGQSPTHGFHVSG